MGPLRTEQDAVNKESMRKLDGVSFLKKECGYTRKSLKQYLRGHLFLFQKKRIDRHLAACAHCKSEFDALKCMEETRQILNYIDPPEGMEHRVRAGVSALAKFKTVLYRPVWLAGLVFAAVGIYYYAMLPRQIDLEIENIINTAPENSSVQQGELKATETATTSPATGPQLPVARQEVAQEPEPLAVSIIPLDEATAIRSINEVMRGHGQLRGMKFSDTKQELSGKLTAQELLTFFDRLGQVAKVRFQRKRLASFPETQQVPFVLTLRAAPKSGELPTPSRKTSQRTESSAP